MTKIIINLNSKSLTLNTNNISFDELKSICKRKMNLSNNFYFTYDVSTTKILSEKSFEELKKLYSEINLNIQQKLNGGLGIFMFAVLIAPMIVIGTAFSRLGDILTQFFELLEYLIEIIPLIFDPPKLIDDILFAVTFGINKMFGIMSGSVGGLVNSPEDENEEQGPFGLTPETPETTEITGQVKCIDPTFTTILLLIICPPLAILLKLGFWAGFISSIICGVLCVKLYYFPGLIFAILHVLC